VRTPYRAPQANAVAERFVRTVRTECLDWLLILNQPHLERAVAAFVNHYNTHRPHRGLSLRPPQPAPPPDAVAGSLDGQVLRTQVTGEVRRAVLDLHVEGRSVAREDLQVRVAGDLPRCGVPVGQRQHARPVTQPGLDLTDRKRQAGRLRRPVRRARGGRGRRRGWRRSAAAREKRDEDNWCEAENPHAAQG